MKLRLKGVYGFKIRRVLLNSLNIIILFRQAHTHTLTQIILKEGYLFAEILNRTATFNINIFKNVI